MLVGAVGLVWARAALPKQRALLLFLQVVQALPAPSQPWSTLQPTCSWDGPTQRWSGSSAGVAHGTHPGGFRSFINLLVYLSYSLLEVGFRKCGWEMVQALPPAAQGAPLGI